MNAPQPQSPLTLQSKLSAVWTLPIKSTLKKKVTPPIDECPSTAKPLHSPLQFIHRMDLLNEKHLNHKGYQYNGWAPLNHKRPLV